MNDAAVNINRNAAGSRDHFLIVNVSLAHRVGISEAAFLNYLISWESYYQREGMLTEDRYFYRAGTAMDEEFPMSERGRRKVITRLQAAGLIKTMRKGFPKRLYFKIEHQELVKVWSGPPRSGTKCRNGEKPCSRSGTKFRNVPEQSSATPIYIKDGFTGDALNPSPPSDPSENVEGQQNQFEASKPQSESILVGDISVDIDEPKKIDSRRKCDSEDMRLAQLWLDKQARPRMPWGKFNIERFVKAISDMRRRVNLTHEQIERVINFLAKRPVDDFLGKNCVSPTGMLKSWKNGMRPIDAVLMALPEYRHEMQRQRIEAAVLSPEEEALIDELFGIEPKKE